MTREIVGSEVSTGDPEGRLLRHRYPADLADFVQEASIGVLLVGGDGRVRWSNKAEYQRLGLSREDLVGKPYRDVFMSDEECDDVLRRLFEGEVVTNCVVTLRHACGEPRYIALDGEAVWREHDCHVRLISRDLTAEKQSQEAMRLQAEMLNAVGQAVIGTDLDGRVTYWNEAAERMYGWSAEQAAGRIVFDLVAPEGGRPDAKEILATIAGGSSWSGEVNVVRRDGSVIPAYVTDTPLLDRSGKPVGMVGVSADVSALKAAEGELRARQRRIEAMGESLPAIVAMASQRHGFYYFNRAWYEFSGIERTSAAISWPDFVHEDDFTGLRQAFQDVLRGETIEHEARLRRHDGQYRWFLIRAVPLAPSQGEPGTAVITGLDITEIKLANQQLESAKSQLETVLRGIADGVTAQDSRGQLVYANDAAARLVGFNSAEEFLSASVEQVLQQFEIDDESGRTLDLSEMPGARARRGQPTEEMLLKFRRKDSDEEHYSLVKAAPVLDGEGNVEYVVDIFRDVTDRVVANQEREHLLGREHEARLAAERSSERLARLQSITSRLAAAWTPQEAGQAVLEEALKSLNACAAAVAILDSAGVPQLVSSHGYSEAKLRIWKDQPLDVPRPMAEVLRSGEPIFLGREAFLERYQAFAEAMGEIKPTTVCAPLKAGGRVLGGMTLAFEEEDALTFQDRAFIVAIAQQCALAIARTQLYQAERVARTQAEDAEARYRILAEAMPQIIWTALPDGSVDYYSPQFYKFTGLNTGDAEGWQWPSLVHPDDADRVLTAWRRCLESGEEFEVQSRILREDGSYCWVLERALPLRDAVGNVIRWLGTITDIDDQKRDQEGFEFLAEASAILSSSLDYEETLKAVARLAVPVLGDLCSVHLIDESGTRVPLVVAAVDQEKLKLVEEVEKEEPFSYAVTTPMNVLGSARPQLWREVRRESMKELGFGQRRIELIDRLGIKSAISVPVSARGKVVAVLSLSTAESLRRYGERDLEIGVELSRHISFAIENALLYRESQQVQEELRLANEAKDEFLGLMSHELRTPITTLFGGAKILRSRGKFLDEEHKESLLNDIETEAEGMHRMIEDLLVLARTGSGELVATEPILANHLIEKVVRGFEMHRPGRVIRVDFGEDVLPVMADNTYMEQILRNLLSNADKYSPPSLPIEVTLRNGDEETVIAVLDRGGGIDPKEAELIFTRFYRAERTARGVRGMGLGLTVCRKLVEAQGGRIWARPRDGGGTEVAFSLPAFTASYDDL